MIEEILANGGIGFATNVNDYSVKAAADSLNQNFMANS
jgi:hypothetical protein